MSRPRRITVVAHELRGFRPVGGMGTATTLLALALARMGHSVEILLGMHGPETIDPHWEAVYRDAGVRIRPAPRSDDEVEPRHFMHTHSVQLGLRDEPADVVIAHDFGAPAYAALRLRQAGVAFQQTLFVIFCHGTRRYIMDVAPQIAVRDLESVLSVAVHEQAAIELADVVVSPSAYLVEWMREQGWRLPERTLVIPYFTHSTATGEQAKKRPWRDDEPLRRLAFFGRLDERKGLKPFAAGLNAIEPRLLGELELEFIGKTTATWPQERVEALLAPRTRNALKAVSFHPNLDQHEALERLSRPGTVAVMPSLQENSPNAVYECLDHGIPFLASNVGGLPELIEPEDRPRVLFEPTAEGVEAALRRLLSEPHVLRPTRPAHASYASYRGWADVVETHPSARLQHGESHGIDVLVVHRTSRTLVDRCRSALGRQSYADFHVTVAEGATVEAARASGLRKGSARYVVFLDEEDVPDEKLLQILVDAQHASDADVVTCGLRVTTEQGESKLHFFTGNAGGLGAIANAYGTVGLYRRDVLGDLTRQWPARDADWPLLAALNAAGARIVSVPLPLVTRTTGPGSVEQDPSDALLVAMELEHALPGPLRSAARLVAGLAAASAQSSPSRENGFAARALRRLLRGRGLTLHLPSPR